MIDTVRNDEAAHRSEHAYMRSKVEEVPLIGIAAGGAGLAAALYADPALGASMIVGAATLAAVWLIVVAFLRRSK